VPGTRCRARSDASKQAAQIGAKHPVLRQSLQARNGKSIGAEEVSVIHPLPWDIRISAAGYSVVVDATGTEVLLAFGDDPQTSRAVAEFVVRSLLSYSRP
jgi:hypothetical protein